MAEGAVPQTEEINDAMKHLRRNAELTRRVRYAAASRLRREKTAARLISSVLSLAIISCSVAILVFATQLTELQVAEINVTIIVISLYMIILSYEFDRRDFDRTISSLERSTARLREFYTNLRVSTFSSKEDVKLAEEAYSAILRENPFPSDDRDYQYVLLQSPPREDTARAKTLTPGWITRLRHQGSVLFSLKWLMLPGALIGLAFFFLAPSFEHRSTTVPKKTEVGANAIGSSSTSGSLPTSVKQ